MSSVVEETIGKPEDFVRTYSGPIQERNMISDVVGMLRKARRPIFIWGAGMRPYAEVALTLARRLHVPVSCTWGAIDLIHHDDPLMAGGFGTHGTRAANFAVQNADLIISIGSRLDTKATGDVKHFARGARLVMVDIDHREIEKFYQLGKTIDVGICGDAGEFIDSFPPIEATRLEAVARNMWVSKIQFWRKEYDTPRVTWPGVNTYDLMKEIGKWTTKEDIIVSDTGTALVYLMQAFPFKGERFLHAFNMTPMGYGPPAAVGAALSSESRIILVTGDGSIMMSLSELATIARWGLNVKIILLNNGGHAMCRQTERQWFDGKYASTDIESGLGFPDFMSCAKSFGINAWQYHSQLTWPMMFDNNKPEFVEVIIDPTAQNMSQARFGKPIEDMEPELSREELRSNMMVPIL